jgi:hypothetical protein
MLCFKIISHFSYKIFINGIRTDQANRLTLCDSHHKIKPISVLAGPFRGQNHPSKR